MAVETWKPCPETQGKLEASDMGRIRLTKTREIAPTIMWGRYPSVNFQQGDPKCGGMGMQRVRVHRLVLRAFYPDPPCPGYTCIDHINGDVNDNRLVNLRWVSHALNMANKPTRGYEKMTGWNKKARKRYTPKKDLYRGRCQVCKVKKCGPWRATIAEAQEDYVIIKLELLRKHDPYHEHTREQLIARLLDPHIS